MAASICCGSSFGGSGSSGGIDSGGMESTGAIAASKWDWKPDFRIGNSVLFNDFRIYIEPSNPLCAELMR